MNIVEALIEAKKNSDKAMKWIIKQYEPFIMYQMNKYEIKDKDTCYEEVKANLYKILYYFDI